MTIDGLIEQTLRDGFFVLPGFFSVADAMATRAELVSFLDEDLALRARNGITTRDWTSNDGFDSELAPDMHNRYFAAWRSPRLAKMMVDLLTDNLIGEFTRRVIGEHYRLRLELVRRSTGVDDRVPGGPPHTWHRDTPGEFTFGIFFDDMSRIDSGGTCVVGGTHLLPYHCLWDLALAPQTMISVERHRRRIPNRFPGRLADLLPLNHLLRARLSDQMQELRGSFGDVYFFFNDTWHGRAPNATGEKLVTIRFGGFPTDYKFLDDMVLPPGVGALPPFLQKIYSADQPVNSVPGLIHGNGTAPRRLDLLRMAGWEKACVATPLALAYDVVNPLRKVIKPQRSAVTSMQQ
jgi:hypothetical protein